MPPLPYRDGHMGRGCVICGQPVFRLGWHSDLGSSGAQNARAVWHACCVVAWRLWLAPHKHRAILARMQKRKCALSGSRLLLTAEVDHRVPLFQVWRDHRDEAWPDLLAFWGKPNLQVVNKAVHGAKSADEARSRARLQPSAGANGWEMRRPHVPELLAVEPGGS